MHGTMNDGLACPLILLCMTNIVLYKQAEGVCLHNLSLSHKYYVMKLAFVGLVSTILPRT